MKDLSEIDLANNPRAGELLKDEFLLETPLGIIRTKVWKLKLGPHRNYRLLYSIKDDERIIYILTVFHRKKSYRKNRFRI